MIVKTAGGSGFCMGVQRAMNLALAAAKAKEMCIRDRCYTCRQKGSC